MSYNTIEYTDMIICYGMADENAQLAARIYAERFPNRERHPSKAIRRSYGRRKQEVSCGICETTVRHNVRREEVLKPI